MSEDASVVELGAIQDTLRELGQALDKAEVSGQVTLAGSSGIAALALRLANLVRSPERKLVIGRDESGKPTVLSAADAGGPYAEFAAAGTEAGIGSLGEPQLPDYKEVGAGDDPITYISPPGVRLPQDWTFDSPPITMQYEPDYLERKYGLRTTVTHPGVTRTGRYKPGDEWQDPDLQVGFSQLGLEVIADMQSRMVEAGLLDFFEIQPGYYGPETAAAMQYLMGIANTTTTYALTGQRPGDPKAASWQDVLSWQRRNPLKDTIRGGGGGSVSIFQPEIYNPPDYADVSGSIKQLFREALGREPRDWEMKLLADRFSADHRASFDATESERRAEFVATEQAEAAARGAGDGYDEVEVQLPNGSKQMFQVPGGTDSGNHYVFARTPAPIPEVNAPARLLERFEQLIAGERANREMTGDVRNNVQAVISDAAGLRSLIGGA